MANIPFRIGAFVNEEKQFLGLLINEEVFPLDGLGIAEIAPQTGLRDILDRWESVLPRLREAAASCVSGEGHALASLQVDAPLPEPRQVFCCGANYPLHVIQMMLATNVHPGLQGLDEAGRQAFAEATVAQQAAESDPYIFMKTVTSIAGPDSTLHLPAFSKKIDWEVELAVVFGREAYKETPESAMSAVAGYLLVNDITARDKVRRTDPGSIGTDWIAGKGAPGFLPMGPWFVPAEFVEDPYNLPLKLWVNGELRQNSNTSEMTFDIARQISFLTQFARIMPGDVLCTGTPEGNAIANGSWLQDGDCIEAEIPGLGRQRTLCKANS